MNSLQGFKSQARHIDNKKNKDNLVPPQINDPIIMSSDLKENDPQSEWNY